MSGNDELAVVYAALILADDKIPVTADKLAKLTSAANVKVESYWFDLFANALGSKDINQLLLSASAAPAAGAAAPAAGGAAPAGGAPAAAKKEEVKEEEKEEEVRFFALCSLAPGSPARFSQAMAFDLFD